jgi:hypothetical protein
MRKFFVIVFTIVSFLTACTKIASTDIGSGLIPPIDRVNTFDTLLRVVTNNFPSDTQRVFKTDDHIIGTTNDPLFGKTTASAYFEVKPTSYPFSFPGKKTDLIVDSAVLVLSYRGLYGDSLSSPTQTLDVREIGQPLKNDSTYLVDANITTGGLLGSKTVDVRRLTDSVYNRFEKSRNQIRIPLTSSFADRFIKQYDSSAAYLNDTTFRERFNGFTVSSRAGTAGNTLIRINLIDTNTKLALYYRFKATDASNIDTAVSYFRFSTGTARVPVSASANLVTRDRKGSPLESYLNTNKTDQVFIHTSPGTFATIKIPDLRALPNCIVHRAELITEQDPDPSDRIFTAPRFLLLSAYDSINRLKTNIPHDFIYAEQGPNIETFGGFLTNKNVPAVGSIVASYTFNLTRYVQGIVSRRDSSYTLRLSAPVNDSLKYSAPYPFTTSTPPTMLHISPGVANPIALGRVRLGGGTNARVPMRLRIIYSRI